MVNSVVISTNKYLDNRLNPKLKQIQFQANFVLNSNTERVQRGQIR